MFEQRLTRSIRPFVILGNNIGADDQEDTRLIFLGLNDLTDTCYPLAEQRAETIFGVSGEKFVEEETVPHPRSGVGLLYAEIRHLSSSLSSSWQ